MTGLEQCLLKLGRVGGGGGGRYINYPDLGSVGKMSFSAKVLESKQWMIERLKKRRNLF